MSRIAPVPPQLAPPDVRAVYDSVMKKFGRLPIPIAVTAHHPEVFAAYMGFERAFGRASKVEAKLTTLAAVKVASLVGCPCSMDVGSAVGRAAGVTEAQLRALAEYRRSSRFSELERLALRSRAGDRGAGLLGWRLLRAAGAAEGLERASLEGHDPRLEAEAPEQRLRLSVERPRKQLDVVHAAGARRLERRAHERPAD